MTQIEILAIVTPIWVGLFVGVLVFVTNYFDDRKAEEERKARLSSRHDNPARTASAAE
jgi:hypothetical protein